MIIGIDPDVHKSGFAVWDVSTKKFISCCALSFFDIIDELRQCSDTDRVILEAGWLNKKSNFHFAKNKLIGERISKNVGANHRIGILIEEYCKRIGLEYQLVQPTNTKTPRHYFHTMTGLTHVKNQDIIDAAMLVYGL